MHPHRLPVGALALVLIVSAAGPAAAQNPSLVNWENPHVHPLDMTPNGQTLLAVNTPDNRLEVFSLADGAPQHVASIPVGLDPVSVRAISNRRAWVVNHISDDVSIVDLDSMNVVDTFRTDDEPCDVVFAGTPLRAYVSCSQTNTVLVVSPLAVHADVVNVTELLVPPGPLPVNVTIRIPLVGEDPRMMAVSPDRSTVYVAVFESGNNTTILGGGSLGAFPFNAVNSPLSPYFDPDQPFQLGVNPPNPPPNLGTLFSPPINPNLPPEVNPPRVGMIVRKDGVGAWMDDNLHDWSHLVSGPDAPVSGRPVGWDLADHDVAVISTADLSVSYATGLMNACMALSVMPNGRVTVVGTEGTNEIRFEPNLNGRFIRVNIAGFDNAGFISLAPVDLNPHLTYIPGPNFTPIPQNQRELSIGDPRGIAWTADGQRGYVTGMGSNNVIVIGPSGARLNARPIGVGEGPTGIVLDEPRGRAYVLNKFDATISTINLTNDEEDSPRVGLFDPTPPAIKIGRKHLYDTHLNSGLGHTSCASCHFDARMDRLAWDLGDPSGDIKEFNQNCNMDPNLDCQDWHPMKGPMTTQTLQDIIGKEPHHWRGDRDGIEEFADAFQKLLGDDQPLPDPEMQEFEDFLATIHFPPNPSRNFDNTLPTNLPLPGHFATGRFADSGGLQPGDPLPNGNAQTGLLFYRAAQLDGVNCVTCHSVPTGAGPDVHLINGEFVPIPPGPKGEHHLMITSGDGSTNRSIKVPHLRNQHEKTGFDTLKLVNTAGFGFIHDGSVDSITRFISLNVFGFQNDQQIADMVALMIAFGGSEFGPPLPPPVLPEPPGVASLDTHAAVGWQTTVVDGANAPNPQTTLINAMIAQADIPKVGLVVKGLVDGDQRGYTYIGSNQFQSDREGEIVTAAALLALAEPGGELTYTVVPLGSEMRIGIDRDEDGFFDRDEIENCGDPANALIFPVPLGDLTDDGMVSLDDIAPFVTVLLHPEQDQYPSNRADFNCDGIADGLDTQGFVLKLLASP